MNPEKIDFVRVTGKSGQFGKITRADGDRVIYAKTDDGELIAFTPKQTRIRDKVMGYRRYRGEALKEIGVTVGSKVRFQFGPKATIEQVFLE